MVEVLRKSLLPLLLAGGLAALGGCSSGHRSEAVAPGTYGTVNCSVGPQAGDNQGNNQGCDAYQDQGEMRSNH